MEIQELETERLILRKMALTDVEGLFELDSNPEVHKYLGNNPIYDKEQIIKMIVYVQEQYRENKIGRWSVIEKKTGDFLGWAGLKLVKEVMNNHINYYDLGYRFIQKYWGKGFATTHIDNIGSNRVLTKVGFQLIETFEYNHETLNWYQLTKAEWEHKNQNLMDI